MGLFLMFPTFSTDDSLLCLSSLQYKSVRKPGIKIGSNTANNSCNAVSIPPAEWEKARVVTIANIENIICNYKFMKKVV